MSNYMKSRPAPERSSQGLLYTAVGGVVWQGISIFYVYVARLIALMILARLLVPSDFGVVAAANVIISLGSVFGHLGVGNALVQRVHLEERHLHTGFWLSLLVGAMATAAVWVSAPFFAVALRSDAMTPLLRLLSVSFLMVGFSTVSRSLLQREMRFRTIAILQATSYTVGYLCIGIPMAFSGYGYWSLAAAHLGEVATNSVMTWLAARHRISLRWDLEAVKQLLSFGGMQTVSTILSYAITQTDKVIVSRWLGATSLGLYTRANYLTTFFASIVDSTLGRIGFIVGARVQKDLHSFQEGVLRSTMLLLMLILPVAALCAILAHEVIYLVLGVRWLSAVPLLQVFSVCIVTDSLSRIFYYFILARGMAVGAAAVQAGYLLATVVCVLSTVSYGLVWVSVGVAIASSAGLFLHALVLFRQIDLKGHDLWEAAQFGLLSTIVAALPAMVTAYLLRNWRAHSITVLVASVFSAALFLFLTRGWLIGVLGPRGRQNLQRIVMMLPEPYQTLALYGIALHREG